MPHPDPFRAYRRIASLLVLGLGLLASGLRAQPDIAPVAAAVTPRLERVLRDSASPWRDTEGRIKVWVHFTDKSVDRGRLGSAMAEVAAALSPRTRQRRSKTWALPGPLVDIHDLPLAPRYLDAVAATGAELRRQSRWLDAASYRATDDQVAAIARLACVREIDLVLRFRRPTVPVDPRDVGRLRAANDAARAKAAREWTVDYGLSLAGLEQINVPAVHELGIDGRGVVMGMLDTGYRVTHEALVGVEVLGAYDFVDQDGEVGPEPGDPPGQHVHGTLTLGTVMGFADGALVGPAFGAAALLAKTEDLADEYPAEEDNWVAGLEWLEAQGVDVVSSSLSYHDWYEFSDMDGNTAVVTVAADLATARGVLVVNSAGNERGDWNFGHISAPADGDSVIAVGAVDITGFIAYFSSPGPTYDGRTKPDLAALGVANPVVDAFDDHAYSSASGTSFACPLVAGVAALVLQRAPHLTPLQVREAMRQTADRAHAPDNDYGWGILDAHAAVTYWGPNLQHEPLGDTEDLGGPYPVAVAVTDRVALDPDRMWLRYRTEDREWNELPLVAAGGDVFAAEIPGQSAGTRVRYYLTVIDTQDVETRHPWSAPAVVHTFLVGPDQDNPLLVHLPIGDQPLTTWPPRISATAADNLAVDRVELRWRLNGGAESGPVLLAPANGDTFAIAFPLEVAELQVGDSVAYTLTAWDTATIPNLTVSGPHAFDVNDAPGVVLIVDDGGTVAGRGSAEEIAGWLAERDYLVTETAAVEVTLEQLARHQVTVIAGGNHADPLASADLRDALVTWSRAGGRLLIEGGHVGYVALQEPGYPDVAAEVLHVVRWREDVAGALGAVGGLSGHPVLTYPSLLPEDLAVTALGPGDQDACEPAATATLVLEPAAYPGTTGLLIHDDNAAPQSAQTVVLTVDVRALGADVGRGLVQNAVAYLLAPEIPGAGTISGRVTVVGGEEAGVAVFGGDHGVVTGPDGLYTLGPYDVGTIVVTAFKPGFTTAVHHVPVGPAEQVTGIDLTILPADLLVYEIPAELPVPDGVPAGVVSTVVVVEDGALASLSVDIDLPHPNRSDLRVVLYSPSGTPVTLHDRSDEGQADLVGNWPATLDVDGPGDLGDLQGEPIAGLWLLHVVDFVAGQAGTLQSWGLNLTVPQVTEVPEPSDPVPTVTRLVGTAPNPFNPQTVVAFDLAREGRVRLVVFDVRGRRVRDLIDGTLPAGRHEVRWDGRDDGGRAVASGTYLVRLRAGEVTELVKTMLVR